MDKPCVYKKISGSGFVFLILYVENILLIKTNGISLLGLVKIWLPKNFSMKDMRETTYIIWIKIYKDRSKRLLGLPQSTYIDKIIK